MEKLTLTRGHGTDVIDITAHGDAFRPVRTVEGEIIQRKIEHHASLEDIADALGFSGYRRLHSVR